MKVMVFGAGPAGLLAAHAARLAGAHVDIWSWGPPSSLYGAQYLHREIPGVPVDKTVVQHQFVGDLETYRHKVYGLEWEGELSPQQFKGVQLAWDIRGAYRWLVGEHWMLVQQAKVDAGILLGGNMDYLKGEYDMVLSTVPRRALCSNPMHEFKSVRVYAYGDAPELGRTSPIRCERDMFVTSGNHLDSWYRKSNVFGYTTVEWGGTKRPPIEGVVPVLKPTLTTCDCWPDINYLGRYGRWTKGVLAHEAFFDTQTLIEEFQRAKV